MFVKSDRWEKLQALLHELSEEVNELNCEAGEVFNHRMNMTEDDAYNALASSPCEDMVEFMLADIRRRCLKECGHDLEAAKKLFEEVCKPPQELQLQEKEAIP